MISHLVLLSVMMSKHDYSLRNNISNIRIICSGVASLTAVIHSLLRLHPKVHIASLTASNSQTSNEQPKVHVASLTASKSQSSKVTSW